MHHQLYPFTSPSEIDRINFPASQLPNFLSSVLARCEWGHDDYSLQVENLPKAPPPKGQMDLFEEE